MCIEQVEKYILILLHEGRDLIAWTLTESTSDSLHLWSR